MKTRLLRTPKPKPRVEHTLDQRQIVKIALELLNERGFDGLSMRNLATKLGVKAASLYYHVQNKQELLSLLAEEICAPMREPDRTIPWQKQLDLLANEFRRILLIHRDAARVLAGSGAPSGPRRLRLTEVLLRTLLDAGFDHKDAVYAGFLLNDYVLMFVSEETAYVQEDAESISEDSSPDVHNWLKALPTNEYPSLVTLAEELMQPDVEERFQFGVEVLRKGLEYRLQELKGPPLTAM